MDDRGVSSVVGKALAAGITVVFVAATTGLLTGGPVPAYERAAGEELSERVLATAATHLERSLPATDAPVDVRASHSLPATIRNAGYELTLDGGVLRLDHPQEALDARTRLSLPPSVTVTNDTWDSGGPFLVRVTGPAGARTVSIR